MDGIIPLYKQKGMTSNDCVRRCRGILSMKRVGHSGTLDPNVDGVLLLCVGRATKVVNYLMDSGKVYTGEITLGLATTTEDLDGEVIETKRLARPFTSVEISEKMQLLTGEQIQIPPLYSAVKVNGRRLYAYARAHQPVERPKRKINVTYFRQTGATTFDSATGQQKCYFEISCGKGTYVRTLATDLGRLLGVPAVMSQLTRQQSGSFKISDTISLSQLEKLTKLHRVKEIIADLDTALQKFEHYQLDLIEWQKVRNGGFLKLQYISEKLVLTYNGKSRCIYHWHSKYLCYVPEQMIDLTEGNQT